MRRNLRRATGFTLIEVSIALAVASFSLVAIFGLLPVGINSDKASVEQTNVTNILNAVMADLRSTPNPAPVGAAGTSPVFGIPIPAATATAPAGTGASNPTKKLYIAEDGQPLTSATGARYQLNVWMTPAATGTRIATTGRLLVTWPAPAAPADALGSMEAFVALDRN